MKITFLGAAHEVTGSCTLVTACGKNILIDCGMEQGEDIYENSELPVRPADIDCVLLTHAHIDHSGMIPALTSHGFSGTIYTTEATEKLCSIMLLDSAHIQESEAQWRNRKAARSGKDEYVPLYTVADAQRALMQFSGVGYDKAVCLFDGVTAKFTDAGHLLGSSSIELDISEEGKSAKLLFSGDIGNVNRPLIRDPQRPSEADYVVIESTYGDRLHGPRADYASQLAEVIQKTLDRGGNVVIPAFAVGRTQEMLYLIHKIKEQGMVTGHDGFEVWVDSPLAVEATKIYAGALYGYYDEETLEYLRSGVNVLKFDGLRVAVTSEESIALNSDRTPKVIISASGMCEAGRIRHHLKHNLWRSESTVLFVGYQSEGTLGRRLIDGARSVKLFNEDVTVRAHIEQMDGVSGHADRDLLIWWLEGLKRPPRKVFVNHGEDTVCDSFAATVKERLGFDAVAPYSGAEFELVTDRWLCEGTRRRISGRRDSVEMDRARRSLYERLRAAVARLSELVKKVSGLSEGDADDFARKIERIADDLETRG